MNMFSPPSRLQSLARFIGRLSLAAIRLHIAALVSWQLLRLYPGDRWFPVRLGSYFAPWLFMTLLPALVIALLGRRRWLAMVILLLIPIFGGRYWLLFGPTPAVVSAETNVAELRVMTFNVHYANRQAEAIAGLIRAEKPDIIALQELTAGLAELLLPQLAADYPHFQADASWGFGAALISRYPLTAQSRPSGMQRLQCARVATPEGDITVWNLHPPTAVNQAGWEAQRHMLAAVAETIVAEEGSLIILGDFNTTNQAENYDLIKAPLTDVHDARGRGFGFTFPEPDISVPLPWYASPFSLIKPVVRIDHILVNHHLLPQETHVVPNSFGSDHRPVVATLRFADR